MIGIKCKLDATTLDMLAIKGCKLCEYIENPNFGYIDTKWDLWDYNNNAGKDNVKISVVGAFTQQGIGEQKLCEVAGGNTGSINAFATLRSRDEQYSFWDQNHYNCGPVVIGKIIEGVLIAKDGVRTGCYIIDGKEYTHTYTAQVLAPNMATLTLFRGSNSYPKFSSGRIYSCQITENNVLVRDLVPCYKTATQEYGMFDRINKTFYGSVNSNKFTGKLMGGQ